MTDSGSAELPLKVDRILRVLSEHGVDFVVIGEMAGIVRGSTFPTLELEVAYARDQANLERTIAALKELEVDTYPSFLDYRLEPETLAEQRSMLLVSPFGRFVMRGDLFGASSYKELRREASIETIEGVEVRVASLDHLIAMERVAETTKARLLVEEYIVIADEQKRLGKADE